MSSCGSSILIGMSVELSESWVDRREFPRSTAELDEEPEFERALATLLGAFEGIPVWQVPEASIAEQGISREQFTYWVEREQRSLRSNSRPPRRDRLRPLRVVVLSGGAGTAATSFGFAAAGGDPRLPRRRPTSTTS